MLNAQDIVQLVSDLKSRDAARDSSYDDVLRHYGGLTYDERKRKGAWSPSSQAHGRHADEDFESRNPINLTRPTVLAKVAFMGLPPTVRVPEPPGMDPEEASQFADNLEKAILGHWAFSNMPRRCYDMAWYQGAFGSAVMGVWPDMRHKRPRIFTRSPQHFYPVTYDEDGIELQCCAWVEEHMDGRSAAARFGDKKFAELDEVEVIQYIDEQQMSIVVENELVETIENKLGFVPVVCIGNIGIPGSWAGDTDVGAAIGIEDEINYRVGLADEHAAKVLNPTIAAFGAEVPEDFELGQGGRIEGAGEGRIDLLTPGDIPRSYWDGISLLQSWYDQVADNPAALRSEGFGSILTGKGFNALLSPLSARLQIRRNLIDPAIAQVNRYLLKMWHDFPTFSKKTKLTGSTRKEMFLVEFSPKDFEIDGEMYTENEVFLSSNSFIDRQGEVVELLQLYQNELASWDTVEEYNPYVTNKARERARIQKDREWKAAGMALAAQMAQSPATANPDIGAQERTAYGLERGYLGEMPTPPSAEAQMPVEAPASGQGQPDIIGAIEEAFSSIPRLKGRIWIGGDLILNPDVINEGGDWKLAVWLEDPLDKATVSNYVKKNIPELWGHLEFHVGEPSDDEPHIEVGGEETGEQEFAEEEFPGGETQSPEETAMEEMSSEAM